MRSNVLKMALFATGLSGIVAEYILSTLAGYFLGDSVVQFTLIVSVMLFAMGLGSRLSKFFDKNLLQTFIYTEFLLSFLVAFSSLAAYSAAAYTIYTGFIIYSLSIFIGLLIGLEIPLAIRLNDEFEELKINVASVIEKDYYGSLAGGIFFAFVGLPILGLTYTPFVLGFVNLSVALVMFFMLLKHLPKNRKLLLSGAAILVTATLILGIFIAKPIILHGEQTKYKDKVIYTAQTRYQRIVITQWKNDYWLYLNGQQQLSTLDEIMYHEPLVHPIMNLSATPNDILLLGGGDGCAAREILKYPEVKNITVVDIDSAMTNLAIQNPILTKLNQNSFKNPKVHIINTDGYTFIENSTQFFDLIIIDLPDPRTVEMGRLYSTEYYQKCYKLLRPEGLLITQAGSPYYATQAFKCIDTTLQHAGFGTLPLHNQILTMGEWGWMLASKKYTSAALKTIFGQLKIDEAKTTWLNNDALQMLPKFGKNIYPNSKTDKVEINTLHNPVLYKYYLNGNWELY